VQVERLVRTRGLTVAQAETRIAAQPPEAEKVAQADVVIDNSGSLRETRSQVMRAWEAIPVARG
jgi:dephospho-CoA kinase